MSITDVGCSRAELSYLMTLLIAPQMKSAICPFQYNKMDYVLLSHFTKRSVVGAIVPICDFFYYDCGFCCCLSYASIRCLLHARVCTLQSRNNDRIIIIIIISVFAVLVLHKFRPMLLCCAHIIDGVAFFIILHDGVFLVFSFYYLSFRRNW